MPLLQVDDIVKVFDHTPVLRGVSFAVDAGEIVSLLGPSGCGKTTLLRIVAGLESADKGLVSLEGQNLAATPVFRRGFGLMFQDFALFPHKTVGENVAFGLRTGAGSQRLDQAAIQRRVTEMLDLVNMAGFERRSVHELSGGEQQRVALARSLAPSPRLLMLDEPLGSLDRTLREELMIELRRILKQIGVTALYVTHDQQEAFAVADRVLILNNGRIEQEGTPLAVYRRPASRFVANFLGMRNLLPGRVSTDSPRPLVATAVGTLACTGCSAEVAVGDRVVVVVRPDAATLAAEPTTGSETNILLGTLVGASFRGSQVRIEVDYGLGSRLIFELPGSAADDLPLTGQSIRLAIDPDGLTLLPGSETAQPE